MKHNDEEPGLDLDDLRRIFSLMPPEVSARTRIALRAMSHEDLDRMTAALNQADPNAFLRWTLSQPGEQALAGMILHGGRTLLMLEHAGSARQ